MNIKYKLSGTKDLKKIHVRFYHNRLDISVDTKLVVRNSDWDHTAEQFKRNIVANKQLLQAKINIEDSFNTDFSTGTRIDKEWLRHVVKETFSRPSKEQKMINPLHTIFLHDFGSYWLENHAKEHITERGNLFSNKAITQHSKAIEQLKNFELKEEKQIKLKDFDLSVIKKFYYFLINLDYSANTAKKTLTEIKFLCKRAKELKYDINLDYEIKSKFIDNSTKIEDIYLNEEEISSIYNHDFSYNEELEIMRDNFILSLWTGLRISDLVNLDQTNLINGFIETINDKTNTLVKIPLHPQVKTILNKRSGNLPPKVKEDPYNAQIKVICRECGINQKVYGKVFDSAKKRKVAKYYHKYELVTSHIGRRSLATNLSGKISEQSIAKIQGWSSTDMVQHYNKKSKAEEAEDLSKIWNS